MRFCLFISLQVMGQVNAQMDPKKTAQVMQEFGRQVEMSNVKEDMLTDALADAVGHPGVVVCGVTAVLSIVDSPWYVVPFTQNTPAPHPRP